VVVVALVGSVATVEDVVVVTSIRRVVVVPLLCRVVVVVVEAGGVFGNVKIGVPWSSVIEYC
jgi:hypothetical protein